MAKQKIIERVDTSGRYPKSGDGDSNKKECPDCKTINGAERYYCYRCGAPIVHENPTWGL